MTTLSPILILGMHRSGTSCLAGCLQEAGLFLGDVNTEAGFNKKGNRENQTVMALHDAVLKRTKNTWDKPPQTEPKWSKPHAARLEKFIAKMPARKIWGVKDPRALLLISGWEAICAPHFIGTFRHPEQTAASLVHRAKAWEQPMTKTDAYDLWEIYNMKLLTLYARKPFDIIRYDIPIDDYHTKLAKACAKLGLQFPQNPTFRSASLHNHDDGQAKIPSQLKVIWEALNAVAR